MTTPSAALAGLAALKKDWHWLLLLGITFVVLGTLAIAMPFLATFEFVTFLGILMLMAGGIQIAAACSTARWQGFLLQLLMGILYVVSGFFILENPVEGAAGLTLLMGVFFLTSGVFRVAVSMTERFPGWGWVLLSGGINILLGLVMWRQFPISGFEIIGLLIGFELLFNGWASIMLALTVKSLKTPTEQSPPAPTV